MELHVIFIALIRMLLYASLLQIAAEVKLKQYIIFDD